MKQKRINVQTSRAIHLCQPPVKVAMVRFYIAHTSAYSALLSLSAKDVRKKTFRGCRFQSLVILSQVTREIPIIPE